MAARATLLALAAAVLLGSCSMLGDAGVGASPRPCVDVFAAERCEAIVTAAAERLGVADADVESVAVLPEPTPRSDGTLELRLGGAPLRVRVVAAGRTADVEMCHGVVGHLDPACMDEPRLSIASPTGGYQDVPCAGEAPEGCATPIPTLEPNAVRAAQPLVLGRVAVPVPSVGRHEVLLGRARLPNGVLTTATAELADPWPDRVRVSRDGIRLDVRSTDPARPPFRNVYEHGWWPGTEEVEVVLVFTARHVEPGATIEVTGVDVR